MTRNDQQFSRQSMTRRRFLIYGGLGAAALTVSGCGAGALPSASRAVPPATVAATGVASATDLLEFTLTARKTEIPILTGAATQVLNYASSVQQGSPHAVTALPDSYLGPIVRVTRGQRVRVHLRNELDEPTTVHWHGLIVPAEVDGHPTRPIAPGAEVEYTFEVRNRPGTYWFHPHPHQRTGEQAYRGLAGLIIVSDPEETALGLPAGAQDIPLILQDRRFDANNQLLYIDRGMAGMMDQMMGILGDRILVNGRLDVSMPVATQPYRLRLLNGSNARIYKLAWGNGAPITVIGSDGGLLAQPITAPYVMLAPGERVEVWADFSQAHVGEAIKLVSLAYEGVEAGAMGMMMGEAALPNGAAFDIMTFSVAEAVTSQAALPETLLPIEALAAAAAVNAAAPRTWVFAMDDAMNWTINGRRYEMEVVADDEKVRFGDTELWELANLPAAPVPTAAGVMPGMNHGDHMPQGESMSGMMMQGGMRDFMAHPVHVHGVQFQVLSREVDPAQRAGWETVRDGLLDQGWKDTVLVMPGERVRIIARFDGYRGIYMIHCHNLEHEDSGMMRNLEVV